MVDFYFVTTLINMLWQIFTVLFVLYRFTSFFSMMYNFMQFLGKLFKGFIYVKDQISLYISRRRGYSFLSQEELNGRPYRQNKSFWTSSYDKISEWIFGKPKQTNLPLYETRTSYIHNFSGNRESSEDIHSKSPRTDIHFENHMKNMMDSNYDSTEFYKTRNNHNNYMSSSIYPPQRPHSHSHPQRQQGAAATSQTIWHTTGVTDVTGDVLSVSDISHQDTPLYAPISQKPFNVHDSNMLFNSHFLTKMLNPFKDLNEELENKDELEEALLKNSNDDYI